MERRENQRVMLTRRLIKESLTSLLTEESIHKISIRALCERAGVNRSTFYKYYGSQYDVLDELEADVLSRIQDALAGGGPSSTRQKLEAVCACLEENRKLLYVLIGRSVDPDFPEKLFGQPEIHRIMMDLIGERYDQERQRYIYVFVVGGSSRLIQEWLKAERRRPMEDLAFLLQDLITRLCGEADLG